VQVSDEAMATLLRRLVVDPVKAVGGDYKRSLEVRPLWFFWFLHGCTSSFAVLHCSRAIETQRADRSYEAIARWFSHVSHPHIRDPRRASWSGSKPDL
jgi:hypothetical protein